MSQNDVVLEVTPVAICGVGYSRIIRINHHITCLQPIMMARECAESLTNFNNHVKFEMGTIKHK